jgi:hypothetical protein
MVMSRDVFLLIIAFSEMRRTIHLFTGGFFVTPAIGQFGDLEFHGWLVGLLSGDRYHVGRKSGGVYVSRRQSLVWFGLVWFGLVWDGRWDDEDTVMNGDGGGESGGEGGGCHHDGIQTYVRYISGTQLSFNLFVALPLSDEAGFSSRGALLSFLRVPLLIVVALHR